MLMLIKGLYFKQSFMFPFLSNKLSCWGLDLTLQLSPVRLWLLTNFLEQGAVK
jgi:hypothetical protein